MLNQETEWKINMVNPKKHAITNHNQILKTKDKEKKSWKHPERNEALGVGKSNSYDNGFVITNHKDQNVVAQNFSVLKEKNYRTRILYLVGKKSLNNGGEIKTVYEKGKLRNLSLTELP